MPILRFYRWPALNEDASKALINEVSENGVDLEEIESEFCFNVEINATPDDDATSPLNDEQYAILRWLFTETFEPHQTGSKSHFEGAESRFTVVEVGPRMAFSTAWSSNAVSICHSCGLTNVLRIERSRRFLVKCVAPIGIFSYLCLL